MQWKRCQSCDVVVRDCLCMQMSVLSRPCESYRIRSGAGTEKSEELRLNDRRSLGSHDTEGGQQDGKSVMGKFACRVVGQSNVNDAMVSERNRKND